MSALKFGDECPNCGEQLTVGEFMNGLEGKTCEHCGYAEVEGRVVREGNDA